MNIDYTIVIGIIWPLFMLGNTALNVGNLIYSRTLNRHLPVLAGKTDNDNFQSIETTITNKTTFSESHFTPFPSHVLVTT